MARLKSTSKDGQGLKKRIDESKGAMKKKLEKVDKADKKNYKDAPAAVKKKIKAEYAKKKEGKATKKKVANKGKII